MQVPAAVGPGRRTGPETFDNRIPPPPDRIGETALPSSQTWRIGQRRIGSLIALRGLCGRWG